MPHLPRRPLGTTGLTISPIGLGCMGMSEFYGKADDAQSTALIHHALDAGVNFFDTADVYGDGRSERLLGRLRGDRKEPFVVATKVGRRQAKHLADGYTRENLGAWVESSLKNLGCETLDLLQLHCPPTDVYYRPEVFGYLDDLVKAGKLRFYGVSVERVEEALKAIEYPNVQSVQIVFNVFRQRPAELFFEQALRRRVGVLARLPLSSGLLTGKLTRDTRFAADDHRSFNRQGQSFDRGETFSGIDYELGIELVEELRELVPDGVSSTAFALRWVTMFEAVSCAIPGAKRPEQVEENVAAADLPGLSAECMGAVRELYERRVREHVQYHW